MDTVTSSVLTVASGGLRENLRARGIEPLAALIDKWMFNGLFNYCFGQSG